MRPMEPPAAARVGRPAQARPTATEAKEEDVDICLAQQSCVEFRAARARATIHIRRRSKPREESFKSPKSHLLLSSSTPPTAAPVGVSSHPPRLAPLLPPPLPRSRASPRTAAASSCPRTTRRTPSATPRERRRRTSGTRRAALADARAASPPRLVMNPGLRALAGFHPLFARHERVRAFRRAPHALHERALVDPAPGDGGPLHEATRATRRRRRACRSSTRLFVPMEGKEKHRVALSRLHGHTTPVSPRAFRELVLIERDPISRASPPRRGHRKTRLAPLRGFAQEHQYGGDAACRRSPGKLNHRCGPCTPARLCDTAKAAAVPDSRTGAPAHRDASCCATDRSSTPTATCATRRPRATADVVGQAVARGGLLRAAHHAPERPEVHCAHHHEVVALLRSQEPAEQVRARRVAQALDARVALQIERARIARRVCSMLGSSDRASRSTWGRPHRASKRHSSRSRRSQSTRRPSARVSVPARLRSPREALRRASR